MVKKDTYILKNGNNSCAVILASSRDELYGKLETAIREEVGAEADGQFELGFGRVGDWGEHTDVRTAYVVDGAFITDQEFSFIKTVSY